MSLNYGNLKNINLPKLDRMIVKNSSPYKGNNHRNHVLHQQPSEKGSIDVSNMLKIEGRSNNYNVGSLGKPSHIRYDYDYELSKKAAERDIKAELRKIYNLRPPPKKVLKRNV